jgi:hypothetical protein
MMKYLILLFMPAVVFGGNWIYAPGGVLPNPDGPYTVYTSPCGADCYQIDPDGTPISLHVASIVDTRSGKRLIEDPAKKKALADKEAAEKIAAARAAEASAERKARLKTVDLTKITDLQSAKPVLQDLIDELKDKR